MSQYENFTSLPPDKEREFVVYEKTSVEAGKKAWRIGAICGAVFGLIVVIIAMSFEAPHNKMADDDMGMLKRSEKKDEPAKPSAPAPAAAPAADTPAEGEAAAADEQ
jgi:hypothetical protein